jgi:hypothetical protein
VVVCSPEHIHLEALPYRYPMRTAVTLDAELWQIEQCMKHKFPRLELKPLRDDPISIVGYGPSLQDTWKDVTRPLMTVSGAHDFMAERGVIPDWHAECDGRDHKTRFLEKPNAYTTYLMATICNPGMWEQLKGCQVRIWHNANGKHVVDWIGENDPGGLLLAGGSVIGLTAIHLAGVLGFRKFKLFGMDGNYRGETRHAGPHNGPPQKVMERDGWKTTPQMSNAVDEFGWLKKGHPELSFEIYGKSLLNDLHGVLR